MSLWGCAEHGLTGPTPCCAAALHAIIDTAMVHTAEGKKLAINRADLPTEVRVAIMEAMQANGDFARADERGDEAAPVFCRAAIAAEARLCDLLAELLQAITPAQA